MQPLGDKEPSEYPFGHEAREMIAKICIVGLLSCGMAAAQSPVSHKSIAAAKPLAFDVVSIRLSKPGSGSYSLSGMTLDGYQAKNVSLAITLGMAYFPRELDLTDKMQGEPSWSHNVMYDIVAKVAPSDIEKWQNQGRKQEMLHAMLQTMLADRCKLVVHSIPTDTPGFSLVAGKHGTKLKEAKPGATMPSYALQFPDGGYMVGSKRGEKSEVSLFGVSMISFATWLTQSSLEHPVFDKTGLTGRYDIVITPTDLNSSADAKGVSVSLNNSNPGDIWNIGALGLKLVSANVPTETFVIDHIERPSEN